MQKTAKIRFKKKEEDQMQPKNRDKSYKFLKIIRRDNPYDILLFEENILNIKDISGKGYILLPEGRIL